MGVLARGSVSDRPWGMTLGALGNRGLTGQLTLAADGKQYRVAFEQGAVVGAHSPMVNDAAVRLALTGNLITSSQVSELTRRIAAAPERDDVDVIAEMCRLGPDQAQRLRRRLVAQRAARTFSVEHGQFVVDDVVDIPVVAGGALDVRAVIYLGARTNLTDERLAAELSQLGAWFKLKPEAISDLAQYGFTDEMKPVLQMLVAGASVADIETAVPGADTRSVRAVTYALATCGACEASTTPHATAGGQPTAQPGQPRTTTMSPQQSRTATAPPGSRTATSNVPAQPRTSTSGNHAAYPTTTPATSRTPTGGANAAYSTPPATSRTSTAGANAAYSTPPATSRTPTGGANAAYSTTPAASRTSTASASAAGSTTVPPAASRTSTTGSHAAYPVPGRAPTAGSHGAHPATGRSPSAPPPMSEPRTSTQHKTGPLGSRSPGAPSQPPPLGAHGPDAEWNDAAASGTWSSPNQSRSPTPQQPVTPRTISESALPPARTRTQSSSGALRLPGGGTVPPPSRSRTGSVHPPMSMTSVRAPVRGAAAPRRPRQNTAATLEIESILQKKIPLLDRGVDYFTLLGLPVGASPEDVRQTYFLLARKLHPDRLSAIGVDDAHRHAQRLMACINEAFAVLNDPARRDEYMSILDRGGEEAVRAEEAKADELAMRVMRAEEAFRQGEMALRREQIAQAVQSFMTAVELAPHEPEYLAMLAWAKFAASSDKQTVAIQTRKALLRAADANEDSPTARFYLGRVERMLGREKEALQHFLEVLRIKPNHAEASSEARILEQRLKGRR